MPKMIKFEQWRQMYSQSNMLPEEVDPNISGDTTADMAELIAKLDDLQAERRKLMKDSHKLEAQLLDIDIKLTRNDIEKLELEERRGKIKKAIEISKETRKEGKIRNEDGEDIDTEDSEIESEKTPKENEKEKQKNPKI
jgi:hypothetical protein